MSFVGDFTDSTDYSYLTRSQKISKREFQLAIFIRRPENQFLYPETLSNNGIDQNSETSSEKTRSFTIAFMKVPEPRSFNWENTKT